MKHLVEWRLDAGLSQKQLANAAGINDNTVSRLEHGHMVASVKTMAGVSRALGVPVREITEFNVSMDKKLNHAA